jgi:hypothetical protein
MSCEFLQWEDFQFAVMDPDLHQPLLRDNLLDSLPFQVSANWEYVKRIQSAETPHRNPGYYVRDAGIYLMTMSLNRLLTCQNT